MYLRCKEGWRLGVWDLGLDLIRGGMIYRMWMRMRLGTGWEVIGNGKTNGWERCGVRF